ncbi:RnfABCDGE type electron transport complex subunit B [candidate division NPL-UPA2 bacterium]|nr:RnfABCDGE type electron transport complex subunit B [candidate division NPL-UPA2 bacterium]
MDTMTLVAVLSMAGLGTFFALVLALASKKLFVKEDPRVERIEGILPGANCGACGSASCQLFAERLLAKEVAINDCVPGGANVAEELASVLGAESRAAEKRTAVVHCGAKSEERKRRADYRGLRNCRASTLVAGGDLSCVYGCLGYGDCARVCPFEAIVMRDGLPRTDREKCTGCGNCVKACPREIISLEIEDRGHPLIAVACSSLDKGKVVKSICPVGCIACKLCEKSCPELFKVEGNLARIIDGQKMEEGIDWKKPLEKCPTRCLVKL